MYSFTKTFFYKEKEIVFEKVTKSFYICKNNRAVEKLDLSDNQVNKGIEFMIANGILFKTDVEYRENLCKMWLEEKDEKTKDYLVNLIVKSYK